MIGDRIVVELGFEATVSEVSRAIGGEGLCVLARIDVKDHFWRDLGRDIRPHVLLEAWSSQPAFEALQQDQDAGATLPTRIAIYELTPHETAVTASIGDLDRERVARILARLPHKGSPRAAL